MGKLPHTRSQKGRGPSKKVARGRRRRVRARARHYVSKEACRGPHACHSLYVNQLAGDEGRARRGRRPQRRARVIALVRLDVDHLSGNDRGPRCPGCTRAGSGARQVAVAFGARLGRSRRDESWLRVELHQVEGVGDVGLAVFFGAGVTLQRWAAGGCQVGAGTWRLCAWHACAGGKCRINAPKLPRTITRNSTRTPSPRVRAALLCFTVDLSSWRWCR